jgi:hypothetical protein
MIHKILLNGFYWESMKEDVQHFVNHCEECLKLNIIKRGFHSTLTYKAANPMDWITLDFTGELEETSNGMIYICIVSDVCTKYTWMKPTSNKNAEEVAKLLLDIFGNFRLPKRISTDQDEAFFNNLMNAIKDI